MFDKVNSMIFLSENLREILFLKTLSSGNDPKAGLTRPNRTTNLSGLFSAVSKPFFFLQRDQSGTRIVPIREGLKEAEQATDSCAVAGSSCLMISRALTFFAFRFDLAGFLCVQVSIVVILNEANGK